MTTGHAMRFKKLDLNLLVALDVLLEEQNITRSAERLNMTQSATSGLLGRLRAYFEDDLLVQVGRKMQPTTFALEIAIPVREILLKINAEITTRPEFNPSISDRNFRIVASDYLITIVLADVISNISKTAPGIRFELLSPSANTDHLLSRGEVDMLIVPERHVDSRQPHQFLFEEEMACGVWVDNPLVGDTITFEQYLEMGHISAGFGQGKIPSVEESLLAEYGISRRIETLTHDFNTLTQLLLNTNRIVTTHKRLLERYAKYLPIRLIPTPVQLSPTREHLVWHRSMDNDPMLRWLRTQISEHTARLD